MEDCIEKQDCKDVRANFTMEINNKLDKSVFWKIIIILASILIGYSGVILNLYITYYSGLGEVRSDIKLIKYQVGEINSKFQNIEIVE